MPSGTGKTVTLLSLVIAYQKVKKIELLNFRFLRNFDLGKSGHLIQVDLLLSNRTGNRKGFGRDENSDGILRKGDGHSGQIARTGTELSKESLHSSRSKHSK